MASSRARGRADLALVCGLLAMCGLGGCGGSAPSEATIYHDPALRPGAIGPASEDERELLSRLPALPDGQSVRVGSRTFVLEPAYPAASGRRCRAITLVAPLRDGIPTPANGAGVGLPSLRSAPLIATDEVRRLACEAPEGWVFVPDVRQDDGPAPAGATE